MTPSENYRLIPLTQGQFAKVNACSFEHLSKWKWFARYCRSVKSFYAQRVDQNGRNVHMHREVTGAVAGLDVDHINCDTLDNRSGNLRTATRAQNCWNKSLRADNTSGYKGVSFRPDSGLWRARIMANGKRVTLGHFATAHEAHLAYCNAAPSFHGEFARTV